MATSGRAGAVMGFVFLAGLVFVAALIARFAGARVPDVVLIILAVITAIGAISLYTGRPPSDPGST